MSKEILKVSNLHRWLGEGEARNHVLKGVDLSLSTGNTYSVVGQSGCGKSTLLYLLGLLDKPDDGSIYIDSIDVSRVGDKIRTKVRNENIGFVFQFHFLLKEFTAAENVMMPMYKHGKLSQKQMQTRAKELLDAVGLSDKMNRFATQLSGGEQQRVAVARSLANYPSLILADEPTGNLDTKNSEACFELLKRLSREMNQAILIVSHNNELAVNCDHVLRMADGQFIS